MEKASLDKVTSFIKIICSTSEFDLIDIEHSKTSNSAKLVIFIDKDGGVTLDDCIDFNELIQSTVNFFPSNPFTFLKANNNMIILSKF